MITFFLRRVGFSGDLVVREGDSDLGGGPSAFVLRDERRSETCGAGKEAGLTCVRSFSFDWDCFFNAAAREARARSIYI